MTSVDLTDFEIYLKVKTLSEPDETNTSWERLWQSMRYSFFSGGKRFRPSLALATAGAFDLAGSEVYGWAAGVEMIHTYSLIHDDLPCMDNDDVRRGQPTNHKKFSEETALLAGDALLTEAFTHLAMSYAGQPAKAVELIKLLGQAAGPRGMVGGQAMDLDRTRGLKDASLELIHKLKTGALIRVSIEGVGVLADLPVEKQRDCLQLGEAVGFAFQLADDLIDAKEKQEECNFVSELGVEGTQRLLFETTEQARQALVALGIEKSRLRELIEFNLNREI